MNSPVTFPAPAPELKLPRTSADKWAATLAEERRRLLDDQEALRERESNLREYEARLRGWQAQLDAGRASAIPAAEGLRSSLPGMSYTPAGPSTNVDTGLQAAWEKLHRAREILEAEQTHLRDDRIAIREMDAAVKRREEAVTARETQLAEREALINAAMPSVTTTAEPAHPEQSMSAVSRITRAPFDLARSVFGGRK
jgi:hypothetical protein